MYGNNTVVETFKSIMSPTATHRRIYKMQCALSDTFHISFDQVAEDKIQKVYNQTIFTEFHKFHPLIKVVLKSTFVFHEARFQTIEEFQSAFLEALKKSEVHWIPEELEHPTFRRQRSYRDTIVFSTSVSTGASD